MITPAEYSKEWLRHASDDIRSAKHLMDMQPPPCGNICFFCQQTVEKALKGFLIFHDQEVPRTHDLELLCDMCSEFNPEFIEYKPACMRLTRYGVTARYPNDLQIDQQDAQNAIEQADAVLTYIKTLLQ